MSISPPPSSLSLPLTSSPSPSTPSSQTPSPSSTPPPSSSPGGSSTPLPSSSSVAQPTSSTSGLPSSSPTSFSTSSTIPQLNPNLTPSESPSTFLSVSNGNTIVVTTIIRSTPTATGVVNTNNTNKGFFQNTGAVAGTFTVVGLVGVAMLIFIITAVMRRRRAERFDKEIALAAAEAAATAHNPGFDDEYGYGSAHAGTGGYGGYADTYQAPVQFPPTREAYGMANVSANAYPDPDNYSVGAGRGPGAAGIGAGALYRSKSGKDQPDPFNAYAIPQDPAVPPQQANLRYRNPGQDHWGDQTLAGGGYDVARSMPHPNPGGVVRNKSTQSSHPAHSLSSHYSTEPLTQDPTVQPPPVPDSYLDRYRAGSDSEKHQFQTRPLSEVSMTDAYGGITTGREPPAMEQHGDVRGISNPFERYSPGDRISGVSDYSEGVAPVFAHDDSRMSLRDDEDYGAGRRVLKVANE